MGQHVRRIFIHRVETDHAGGFREITVQKRTPLVRPELVVENLTNTQEAPAMQATDKRTVQADIVPTTLT